MKRTIYCILTATCLTVALFSSSCNSGGAKHGVTIWWEVAGAPSCSYSSQELLGDDTLIFEEIHIEVFEEGDEDGNPIMFFDVPCEEYSYTIQNLEEGEYFVTLGAMAEYEGDYLPYFQASEDIESPADEDKTFQLVLGTGSVQVSWGFEMGMCGPNGVDYVDVTLSASAGSNSQSFDGISCDDGFVLAEEVDWDTYSVQIEGFDSDGAQTHYGESAESFVVKPGDTITSEAYVELMED